MTDLTIIAPELTSLIGGLVFMALALRSRRTPDAPLNFSLALAMALFGLAAAVWQSSAAGLLFKGVYRVDAFSQLFKLLLCGGLVLILFLCRRLDGIGQRWQTEFFALLFVCHLAMLMLSSSVHLLTIYLSLELSSYGLYILVFLREPRRMGVAGGLPYFLMGITASALMLFGMAMLYATAQTVHLEMLVAQLPTLLAQPLTKVALVLLLGGFLFKLAVVPFHFWAPAAYGGGPNQVAAFIATISKVAAISVLIRIVGTFAPADPVFITHLLVTLAIITMTVGNLSAIGQSDLKRLLAFSSVAHAGYILIGLVSLDPSGFACTAFYGLAVLLMKFTCFMVVVALADGGQNLKISDLAGLHQRAPLLAVALMLALFGLAGIPPTIGFTGKLLIFKTAMQQGHLTLVLIAMANVVVSLYYYLLVLKAAYLTPPETEQPPLHLSVGMRSLALLMIVLMVGLGLYPAPLVTFFDSAMAAFPG